MSVERIDLARVRELIGGGAQLVEVLPPEDYEPRHLPGAINLPLKHLDAEAAKALNPARDVVVYCWDGL